MKFILMANIFAHDKNDEKTALIYIFFNLSTIVNMIQNLRLLKIMKNYEVKLLSVKRNMIHAYSFPPNNFNFGYTYKRKEKINKKASKENHFKIILKSAVNRKFCADILV